MCLISSRSLQHSLLMGIDSLLFSLVWRLRSLLKKLWTNGMAIPRCPSCLIMLSTSLAVVVSLWMIVLMRFVQSTNLFFGNCTRRHLVSSSHPRMVFHSSSPASAWSLFHASISLHDIGSLGCIGHAQMSMASRVVRLHQVALSMPSMTTVAWMRWSILMSQVLCGSTGISTMSSAPSAKGMEASRSVMAGTRCWLGA